MTSVSRNRSRLVSRPYAWQWGKCIGRSTHARMALGWSCIVCLGLPKTHVGWACVEQEGTRSERRPGDSYCPFPTDMTVFVEGKATRKVFLSWRTLAGSTEKLRRSGRPLPGPQRRILLRARARSHLLVLQVLSSTR